MPYINKEKLYDSRLSIVETIQDMALLVDNASDYQAETALENLLPSCQINISDESERLRNKLGQQIPGWYEYRQKGYNTVEIEPDLATLKALENMIPELLQGAPEALLPVINQIRDAVQALSDSLNSDWDKQKLLAQNREEQTRRMAMDASPGGGLTKQNPLTVSEIAKSVNQLLLLLTAIMAELKLTVTIMDSAIPAKIKAALAENLLTEITENFSDPASIAGAKQEVTAMLSGNASSEINEMFTGLVNAAAENVTTSLVQQLSTASTMIKNATSKAKFQAGRISQRANENATNIATAVKKVSDSLNRAAETVSTFRHKLSPPDSSFNRLIKTAKKVPDGIKTGADKLGRTLMSGVERLGEYAPENLSEVSSITFSPPAQKEVVDDVPWRSWQALSDKIQHKLSHARQAGSKAKYEFTQRIAPDMPETTEFSARIRTLSLPLLAETEKLSVAAGRLEITLRMAIKPGKQKDSSGSVSAERGINDVENEQQQTLRGLLAAARENTSASGKAAALSQQSKQQRLSALNTSAETAQQTAEDVKKAVDEDAFIAEMATALQQVPVYPGFLRKEATARLDRFAPTFKKIVQDLRDTAELLRIASQAAAQEPAWSVLRDVMTAKYRAAAIKRAIKERVSSVTGTPLHNYSRSGMLAKAIGEWLASEKQALLQSGMGADPKFIDRVFERVINGELKEAFVKENDPQGDLMSKRVELAVKDVLSDSLLWPQTPEEKLVHSRPFFENMLYWSEKRVTNIARFVGYGNDALEKLISPYPKTSLLRPRIRYLRLMLAPVSIMLGVREIKKRVRPGNSLPSELINEYIRREILNAAFRLFTFMLPPLVNHGMALALTGYGLYRGGVYRDEFIERAIVRAPKDALWEGGYVATGYGINAAKKALLQSEYSVLSKGKVEPALSKGGGEYSLKRGKRHVVNHEQQAHNRHNNFDKIVSYRPYYSLPEHVKKMTYLYGIRSILIEIENDESLPEEFRNKAYLARIGAPIVVPLNMSGNPLNNSFLIPDEPGARTGIYVQLGSSNPYYYVGKATDIREGIKNALPYKPGGKVNYYGIHVINTLRSGEAILDYSLNQNNPDPMDIGKLSVLLAKNIEEDYKRRAYKNREYVLENKKLITRAIVGSQIPDPGVSVTPVKYKLQVTWESLTPAEYLRSISCPFSTLSGQMQLIVSDARGESIIETEKHVEEAKYIGTWIDVTVGVATSFTGTGIVFGMVQSAAEIAADISEGKDPDPLAVAGLVVGCIPGGKIAPRIGKFSKIGAKGFKYALKVGDKVIDLADLGIGIKTAVETGDLLAIYQTLIASGMSAKNAHDTTNKISNNLKIKRAEPVPLPPQKKNPSVNQLSANTSTRTENYIKTNTAQDSSPVQQVESTRSIEIDYKKTPARIIEKMRTTAEVIHPAAIVHKFRIGKTEMLGRKNKNAIEISRDGGVTWTHGNNIHKFAFILQSAGGKTPRPVAGGPEPDAASAGSSAISTNGTEQHFIQSIEKGQDPAKYLHTIKRVTPDESVKSFHYFGKPMKGRVRDGNFEISSDGGSTWSGGSLRHEVVWRWRSWKNMSIQNLDKNIDRASKKDPTAYSFSCYVNAFNDASQAEVITPKQKNWLVNKVARPDSKGEIIGSDRYRQAFSLQNKQPLTTFESANISESGFMHLGERRPDGIVVYDHVVYVHVTDNGIYLYQANGSDFLRELNRSDPLKKHNNIGAHTSKSHYKHAMDKERTSLFDGYFAKQEQNGSQAVFVFTPASEIRDNYIKQTRSEATPDILASKNDVLSLKRNGHAEPILIKREPVLGEKTYNDLTPAEKKCIQDTNLILQTSMSSDYVTSTMKPKKNSAHAAKSARYILQQNGFTDVRIVEMGIWPNGRVATTPTNHYVVIAKKSDTEIVVDLTAGQFERYGFTGPVIDTRNNWISRWQQEMKSKPRTLVKLAPVTGSVDTSTFSSFTPYNDARKTVPDGELIQSPAWYQNANLAVNPERRAVSSNPAEHAGNKPETGEHIGSAINNHQATQNSYPAGSDIADAKKIAANRYSYLWKENFRLHNKRLKCRNQYNKAVFMQTQDHPLISSYKIKIDEFDNRIHQSEKLIALWEQRQIELYSGISDSNPSWYANLKAREGTESISERLHKDERVDLLPVD